METIKNDQLEPRAAVRLRAKVRDSGFGLRPRLYTDSCLWQ